MNLYIKFILFTITLIIIILLISSFFTYNAYILIDHIGHVFIHNKKSIKNLLKQENNVRLPDVEQTDEIPKIIFQTHKRKELIPDYYIENLKNLNKDWDYRFFDNQDAKKFLREEFGKEFEDKFDYFKSGPHKADLWRLCVLYKYGGCYLDADVEMYKSFDYIIEQNKEDFIVAETITGIRNKRVFNAIMFCKPGDKLVEECIKRLMLVENRYLDTDYLYIIYLMTEILQGKLKNNKLFEKYESTNSFKIAKRTQDYYLFIDNEKIGKSRRKDYSRN